MGEGASAVVPMARDGRPVPVLIAEVLLQRSRGKTVATVYDRLFTRWPTAEGLSRARVDSIASVIRPLGLVRRAATLKSLAMAIVEHGCVPGSMDELLSLPGVGRYAASATLAVAFEMHAPVVDGVTARVYRRFFGMESSVPAASDGELWELVAEVTPRQRVREWNWAVLDLAASVCLPKIPRCEECPLRSNCAWKLTDDHVGGSVLESRRIT